jgi:quercetin dioxygenase-like cupin family protein
MIGGEESGGNFALVEHPIGARALAAPMHTHEREDEYTYVLAGEVGVKVGEEVLLARPGDLVFKPPSSCPYAAERVEGSSAK